ncbi:MAG: twin-arginine translocation signal domain-containing protein [Patescibacteria group bacterium]
MSESGSGKHTLSRRDFLKIGGAAIAAVVAGDRVRATVEMLDRSINMSAYVIKNPLNNEHSINFPRLLIDAPHLVKHTKDGFEFHNAETNPFVLDFSSLAGEKIRLSGTKDTAAWSNAPWDKYKSGEAFGSVDAGLVFNGNFTIKGDVGRPPIFLADNLDRAFQFHGDGKTTTATVQDIKISGLRSYAQTENGDGNVPSPAYIVGDDVNLTLEGVLIDHKGSLPDGINETNAQLTKGVMLHNTKNNMPLHLSITHSALHGLQWDGIYANGKAQMVVDTVRLYQDAAYKQQRGVAIASTFNDRKGFISVQNSDIRYCKGTAIWTSQGDQVPGNRPNILINGSSYDVNAWSVNMDKDQSVRLATMVVKPYWDSDVIGDPTYWPMELWQENAKPDLSFGTLEFAIKPTHTESVRLLEFVNWHDYDALGKRGLQTHVREDIKHIGDIVITTGERMQKITRDAFLTFLGEVEKAHPEVNPAVIRMIYDPNTRQVGVQFATAFDKTTGNLSLSDFFWMPKNGESTPPVSSQKGKLGKITRGQRSAMAAL